LRVNYPRQIPHWLHDHEVLQDGAALFEKQCPRDGKVIAQVFRGTAATVDEAIGAAVRAQPAWEALPAPARGEVLGRVAAVLRERSAEATEIIGLEVGKPPSSAAAEVAASADLALFMASEAYRFYGKTTVSPVPNRSVRTVRQPIGVCAAITPFNSPLAGITWKAFPALVCGNAVVVKSHEFTPYTCVWLGRVLRDAGLPPDLYTVVQGYGDEVGRALVSDDRVGLVSFTGSVGTGKRIQAAVTGRRVLGKVCLELGGKNPLVVCDDADVPRAATHAVASAFVDAGQRCASASRLIVFDAVYDEFRRQVLDRARALKVGSSQGDDVGPVITSAHLTRLLEAVTSARARGIRVACGGSRAGGRVLRDGFYMTPTVLEDADPRDSMSQEELFGPITCLYRVRGFAEALALANGTSYGLTGAIHTRSVDRMEAFIAEYRAGLVSINGPTYGSGFHMPFGGIRNSGNGFREPGTEALDVYTDLKTVVVNYDPTAT
jgi:acyl-CoA reductase-like NAD-dependent aldehyde dehydrogenase